MAQAIAKNSTDTQLSFTSHDWTPHSPGACQLFICSAVRCKHLDLVPQLLQDASVHLAVDHRRRELVEYVLSATVDPAGVQAELREVTP